MSEINNQILDLIPHRPPMLLINRVLELGGSHSLAEVNVNDNASFFIKGKGVPAWIGIEYMGQTAALIAGYQQQRGLVGPHLGFLLGTRRYTCQTAWFEPNSILRVACNEIAVVGDSLANFNCVIKTGAEDGGEERILAEARLSVLRKKLEDNFYASTH